MISEIGHSSVVRDSRSFDFRRLWTASSTGQFGAQLSRVVLPLAAVGSMHATPFEVGVLATLQVLGYLLIGLPAGVWIDRFPRPAMIFFSGSIRAALFATVPAAAYVGALSLWQLFVVALGTGLCTVLFETAVQSALPEVVPSPQLVKANARLEASRSVTQVVGPSVGGYLAQILSAPYSIIVAAASMACGVALVKPGRIRRANNNSVTSPFISEIWSGLLYVRSNATLRALALYGAVYNFFWAMTAALLVPFLQRAAGLSDSGVGLFFASAGVAGFLGSLIAARVTVRWGTASAMVWGAGLAGLFGLALPVAYAGWSVWLAAAANALSGLALVIFNVNGVSLRQRLCKSDMLGRVNATTRFVTWGVLPLGALLGGVLGQVVGLRPAVMIAAVGAQAAVATLFLSPIGSRNSDEPGDKP